MSEKMIQERYLVVRKIGEGGMADVYLAMDTVLNREVAIKILRGDLSGDPVALLRFQREANSASGLNHENIVEIYDIGEDHGQHYIVMEYIRGKTLKQLIKSRGVLDKVEAVAIMKQLVSGVAQAHTNGIIHRDIKPQNIMIKDDGTVKITDFGIATAADALQLTQSDSVMGSVHYLAPECSRGEPASFQSDIYSMGIVFFEMVTGEVPHRGEGAIEVAMKHMQEEIPDVRSINPSLPMSIANIVHKATAKNKVNRYCNAQELLEDIDTCLDPKRENEAPYPEDEGELDKTIMFKGISDKSMAKPKRDWAKIALFSFIGVAVVTVVIVMAVVLTNRKPVTYVIPNVIGMSKTDASAALTEAGFDPRISYDVSADVTKDNVFKVSPDVGTVRAEKGTRVTIYVSLGKNYVVENFVGKNIDVARSIINNLTAQGINLNVQTESVQSKDHKYGEILAQSISEGTEISPNTLYTINFQVADYPRFIIPTSILGADVNVAKTTLEGLGATVSLEKMDSSSLSAEQLAQIKHGVVIEMSPTQGTEYVQNETNSIILKYYE